MAQKDSIPSIDSSLVYVSFPLDDKNFYIDSALIDTSLLHFNIYDPVNYFFDNYTSNGNLGTAHKSIIDFYPQQSFFNLGENLLNQYSYSIIRVPRYKSYFPYSEVKYVMGGNQENFLNFTLGSKIGKQLYLGFDYRVDNSIGMFVNQNTKNSHLMTNFLFHTLNKRYQVFSVYAMNSYKINENGGISNRAEYEDSVNIDPVVIDIFLLNARNYIKTHDITVNQSFFLSKLDSNQNSKLGLLIFDNEFSTTLRQYTDEGNVSNFYQNSFEDSLSTFDSSHVKKYTARFGWYSSDKQESMLRLKLFSEYRYVEFYNQNALFSYHFVVPKVSLSFKSKFIDLQLNAQKSIPIKEISAINYKGDDFFSNAFLKLKLSKNYFLNADISINNFSPEFSYYFTYGNHYRWFNNLGKISQSSLKISTFIKGYSLEAQLHSIDNYTFIDSDYNVKQVSNTIGITQLKFYKKFNLNKFGIVPLVIYQTTTANSTIEIPKLIAKLTFDFTFPLFKRAIYLHPGIDITYISEYFSDFYNPALAQFVHQKSNLIKENYNVDVFLNLKVKRARIFVMYSHLPALLDNYYSYSAARYPTQGATLKFGVAWRFYN